MKLAAIILAAGTSSRMGSPKPLLKLQGETFLDRLIRTFSSFCSPVIVVVGHRAEDVRGGSSRAEEAEFVLNAGYLDGQFSSLQCGLKALPDGVDGFLFCPVDTPNVRPETVAAIAGAFESGTPPLVIPCYDGRRGHPVCCSARLIPEFLDLPSDSQARHVIHRHLHEAVCLEVPDPGILEDIDDPESYQELLKAASSK